MPTDSKFNYYMSNRELGLNAFGIKDLGSLAPIPVTRPMPAFKGGKDNRVFNGMRGGYISKPGHYTFSVKVGSAGRICASLGPLGTRCFDGSEEAGLVFETQFEYNGTPMYRPHVEICGMVSPDWLCRFTLESGDD